MLNKDMTDTNQNSWLEKYRPKSINGIKCNRRAIDTINNWLINFEKSRYHMMKQNNKTNKRSKGSSNKNNTKKSCLIVTGNHGVGKTVSIDVILKERGYEVHTLDFINIKKKHNIKESIKKIMKSSNILDLINDDVKKKVAVVIDEIEGITSTTEKNCILTLQKENDSEWYCPIIFISNNKHNKLLAEIKKASLEVKFNQPYDKDLRLILKQILRDEAMKVKDSKVEDTILYHSQGDIRRLIYTLQELQYAYGNKLITSKLIEDFCQVSKRKDVDIDLFTSTKGLLYKYNSINDCLRYYETEKVLLPLMVHQNYVPSVILNIEEESDQFDIIKNVSESLSCGDVVENYIYGDQNWDMQEIHGFHTCAATSYYLCEKMDKSYLPVELVFTTDLNKTSIKKINKKNINNTNRCFDNMNIFDYIYINKIIRELINQEKIEECVKLMIGYNIKLEHIESLLKIDKIKNTKTSLTSKQKKKFIKYLEEG